MSQNNKKPIFDGYINDINKAFESLYGKTPTTNDSDLLTKTLFNILDSYYFKELYNYKKIGVDESGAYTLKAFSNAFIEDSKLYKEGEGKDSEVAINKYMKTIMNVNSYKIPSPNDIDINYYPHFIDCVSSNSNLATSRITKEVSDLSHKDEDLMKSKLKEINSIYEVLFEENPVKRQLYLKEKEDLKISIIPDEKLNEFINNLKIKSSTDNVHSFLKENYDLRYFSNEELKSKSNNYTVIAHNDFEIAGLVSVKESESMANSLNKYANKFMTAVSVMVAKSFRGQSLGVKMFEEVLKDADKNDYIVIRTGASENGRNYLRDNITQKSKQYSNVPVIQSEVFDHLKYSLPSVFNNSDYSTAKTKLKTVLNEVSEFQEALNKEKSEARSSDEFYAIADKEEDFYKQLGKKFPTQKPKQKLR